MIKTSVIRSSNNSLAIDQITYFFQNFSFKLVENGEDKLKFKKGSYISNFVTFDPLKWKSTVTVKINKNEITTVFEIKTTGQIVTKKEIELWDNFIQNFEAVITNSEIDETKTTEIRKEIDNEGGKLMVWSIVGGAFGVFIYFLFKQSEVNFILAGFCGAIVSLMFSLAFAFITKSKKRM